MEKMTPHVAVHSADILCYRLAICREFARRINVEYEGSIPFTRSVMAGT